GLELIETIQREMGPLDLPIIVYNGTSLSEEEQSSLRTAAGPMLVKAANSPQRLLSETFLFLHRTETSLPQPKREMLELSLRHDQALEGRKALIVDDDARNVFALISALEAYKIDVLYAENGQTAIDTLNQNPNADVVLMDIMMPERDGYETMRAIRR